MRNVWIASKTTPRVLWLIGGGCLGYLLAKIYVFDSLAEIFPRAYEVGHVFQDLVEAIAALIFFVFSYQLPFVIEQQRIDPSIDDLITRVSGRVHGAFGRAYRGRPGHPVPADLNLNDVTLELVRRVFTDINPNAPCPSMLDPLTGRPAAWAAPLRSTIAT